MALNGNNFVVLGECDTVPAQTIRRSVNLDLFYEALTKLSAQKAKDQMEEYAKAGIIPYSTIGGEIQTVVI